MNKPLRFSTSVNSPPLVAILPGLEIIASVRLGEDPMNLWLLWQQLLDDIRPYLTHTYDNLSTQLALGSAAQIVRNQHFWQWVMQTLSAQEIHTLHSNAQKLIQLIEEFKFMESLTHPSLLVPRYC